MGDRIRRITTIDKTRILRGLIYGLPLILFVFYAAFVSVGMYADTYQYVEMHIHRDPLYPLFLFVIRTIMSGNEIYYNVAVWLQNILAWISVVILSYKIGKLFNLNNIEKFIVVWLCMIPHVVTPIAAQSGLILSNAIMSESLSYPLFYLFAAYAVEMVIEKKKSSVILALIYGLLLSLARGQMIVMIIAWLILAVAIYIETYRGEIKRILLTIFTVVLVFALAVICRGTVVKTYNRIFNNHYIGTTLSEVSLLSNILYATDPGEEQKIEDPEVRRFFTMSYDLAVEREYNYSFSEKGILNRGMDLENTHDSIKFECVDELWRQVHDEEDPVLKADYELETYEQDIMAGKIISEILIDCIGTWMYDYIALSVYGLIRTVSIARPVFIVWAVIVYLFLIAGTIFLIRKKNKTETDRNVIWFVCSILLMVCANVFGTAVVIMCLSRYMLYLMPLVYIAVGLLLKKLTR